MLGELREMDSTKLKLKLKNYWRKHEKFILAIIGAFILGVLIAGVNFLHHENSTNKFQLDEPQNITSDSPASFSFTLQNPELATTEMTIRSENITSDPPVKVYVNGEELGEIQSAAFIQEIPNQYLEKENEVELRRSQFVFDNQILVDAKVTSTTSLRELMFVLLNFASFLLMAAPLMYVKYKQYKRQQLMEDKFPEFLRDVVEGTRAGMSLPQAIQNTETGSYGPLDEKIEKMDAQLDWGIPFDDALQNFAKGTNSKIIQRSVDTIIQAYTSGGNIQDVLESVGDNIRTIKELKEERESQLYGEMVTGYIVYFIFIGILIALTNYLLPNLASAQQSLGGSGQFSVLGGGGGGTSLKENIALYETWFKRLVYIQALFSGLIIGKLAEGELKAGFKHVAILFAIGYLAITFFL